ncbi:MAG: hypothetical protein JO041_09995 [Acidobacteria bacterium]|nr:hypothetical protein [Acidobacteriota bacterium]
MKTAAALFLFASTFVNAQDLVAVAPDKAKVEYEDSRVRVVRLKLAPNEVLPMHDRPARVVVSLAASNVRILRPDGTSSEVRTAPGTVAWSEPARRSVQNLDAPLENVIVELKMAKEPAKALAAPPNPRPEGYLDEPLHRWAFENQYVRVYDVRVPAGATTGFHKHAYDTVFVQVTEEISSEQLQGEPWGKPEKYPAGEAAFSMDSKKLRVHRVRNEGNSEFRVIAVQVK